MEYWITIKVKVQRIEGTTLFNEGIILMYSDGLKKVAQQFKEKFKPIFLAAWNACRNDVISEKSKKQSHPEEDPVKEPVDEDKESKLYRGEL